ncbi:MAG: HEAT repeat domain-containing protein, partial [Armatimonadota bacterium]
MRYREDVVGMRRLWLVLTLLIIAGAVVVAGEPVIQGVSLTQITADLESGDQERQSEALSLLKEAGPEGAAAVPAVSRILDSTSPELRSQAALTLGMLGDASAPVLAKLQQVMANDPHEKVQEMAWFAHASLAGPDATPAMGTTAGAERLFAETPPPTEGQAAFNNLFGEAQRYSQETTWPQADADVTDFLQPLRNHHAKLAAIKARLDALASTRPADNEQARQWTQDLQGAGQDLVTESRAFRATLHRFITTPKRRGLSEEFDLIQRSFEATDGAAVAISNRSGFDVQGYALDRNLRQQAAGMRQKMVAILAEEIDHRMEAEGFFVLLATEGLASVRNEAMTRLGREVEEEMDRLTERELGIAFHDERSFSTAVQHKIRSLVRGKVHQLLFKITSNAIIVEILGAPIIRWLETDLWPRLKEAFRNKGDLEFRTERSIASLIRAKDRLWALPRDATLDSAEAERRNAAGALMATKYLVGDLQRANRTDLYDQLKGAAKDLAWVIDTTAHRFLLDKIEDIEKLEAEEETYRALIAMIDAMVRDIEMPSQVARGWG